MSVSVSVDYILEHVGHGVVKEDIAGIGETRIGEWIRLRPLGTVSE